LIRLALSKLVSVNAFMLINQISSLAPSGVWGWGEFPEKHTLEVKMHWVVNNESRKMHCIHQKHKRQTEIPAVGILTNRALVWCTFDDL